MAEKAPQSFGLPESHMDEGDTFLTPAGGREKVLRKQFREGRVRFLVVEIDSQDREKMASYHWTGYMDVKKSTLVE